MLVAPRILDLLDYPSVSCPLRGFRQITFKFHVQAVGRLSSVELPSSDSTVDSV